PLVRAPVLEYDAYVTSIQVGGHVCTYHRQSRGSLQPDRAGDPTVVPPVRQAPRDDVQPRTPGWVVHPQNQRVERAGSQRIRGIERERRPRPLVIAEVVAVEPGVDDVAGRLELQCGEGAPVGRNQEADAIPTTGDPAGRRRGKGAWNLQQAPARGVVFAL